MNEYSYFIVYYMSPFLALRQKILFVLFPYRLKSFIHSANIYWAPTVYGAEGTIMTKMTYQREAAI